MNLRSQHMQLETKRSVAHISLNHPPGNYLGVELIGEINRALETVGENRAIKVLLFTSKLKDFCLGLDLSQHNSQGVFQLLDGFHQIIKAIHSHCIPSVSVINGAALGAGCSLATVCDFVLATTSARFGHPEVEQGTMATVGSLCLPEMVGLRTAKELLLTGKMLTAEEARRLGLVNWIHEETAILGQLEALLGRLTALSAPVLRMALRSIRYRGGRTFTEALQENQELYLNQLMELEDAREGIAAARENRKPHWKNL